MRCKIDLWQNPKSLHDKSFREIKDTKDIMQKNRNNL